MENTIETWKKLCRACLTTRETFTYYLFENVSSTSYAFCTSIEVKKDDGLPKALCDVCYKLLTQLSEFKNTCLTSENKLLSQLNFHNAQVKKETQESDFNLDHKDNIIASCKNETNVKHFHDESTSLNNDEDMLLDGDNNKTEISQHKNRQKTKRKILSDPSASKAKEWKRRKIKKRLLTRTCSKEFKNSKDYEEHILTQKRCEKTIYPCSFCVKTFATWSGLQRHRESKHSVMRLQELKCKVCGRVCASRQSLHMHSKRHGTSLSIGIMCHVCGRKCANDRMLKAHLETHAENRERLHTCEHCGKKYYSNNNLLSHILRLHKNTRYICDYCNYPFTEKQNLVKHIQIHTGQKDYQCDICSKEFNKSSTLTEHKRIHSGERPFNCRLCPKSFISKRRLTEHIRVHTGERPFKCPVCDHRFTQKGTMQRHAKTHLNPCKVKTLF